MTTGTTLKVHSKTQVKRRKHIVNTPYASVVMFFSNTIRSPNTPNYTPKALHVHATAICSVSAAEHICCNHGNRRDLQGHDFGISIASNACEAACVGGR